MIIGAIGVPHAGKTTLLRRLVRLAAAGGNAFRVVDAWGSFDGRGYSSATYYRSAVAQTGARPRVAVFAPSQPLDEEELRAWAWDIAAIVDEEGGTLVLDEIGELLEGARALPAPLRRIAHRGYRTPQAGLWYGAQRASHVPRSIQAHTRCLYVFRQVDELDLDWLRRNLSPHGRAIAALAPTLPDLHYIAVPRWGGDLASPRVTRLDPDPLDFARRARG